MEAINTYMNTFRTYVHNDLNFNKKIAITDIHFDISELSESYYDDDLYKINHACKRIMEESIELMLELIIKDMEADSLPKNTNINYVIDIKWNAKELFIEFSYSEPIHPDEQLRIMHMLEDDLHKGNFIKRVNDMIVSLTKLYSFS